MQKEKILLLSGSNLGLRKDQLGQAENLLSIELGPPLSLSSLYETEAWGRTDQPPFLNQVLMYETMLSPHEVLDMILQTEKKMGRIRTEKWATRSIDIDLLFYGQQVLNDPDLTVPHPYLHLRRFTLAPLCEIAPGWVHPLLNKTCRALLDECSDPLEVHKL